MARSFAAALCAGAVAAVVVAGSAGVAAAAQTAASGDAPRPADRVPFEPAGDLSAAAGGDPAALVVLLYSVRGCPWCLGTRRELRSFGGQHRGHRIVLREVGFDVAQPMRDFAGTGTDTRRFAQAHGVGMSPTVAIHDAAGRELVPMMVGQGIADYYAYNVRRLFDDAVERIEAAPVR